MKALEFLNKNKVLMLEAKEAYENEDCGDYDYDSIILTIKEIDEAIEELEALDGRSCENCKYSKEIQGIMVFCDKKVSPDLSKMMWHSFTKDYCCKFWEAKQ